jgi:hypothetical protein
VSRTSNEVSGAHIVKHRVPYARGYFRYGIAAWLCLVFLPACGGGTAAGPGPTTLESLSLKLETAHFRVLADRATPTTVQLVADALEANRARIEADLEVASPRTTTVEVWTDAESFYRDMQATIGQRVDGATGYVSSPADLAILAGSNVPASTAVHEFCHCVMLRLNASIGNNPRWLWETVALYENGQFVDPRTVSYLRAGTFPTLAQLNSDYQSSLQIYDVGYLLGEFIVATWGQGSLARLVRDNGDIERVLGISVGTFQERWQAFVRAKYLS